MKDYGGAYEALRFAETNIPPHAMDDDRMWKSLSYRYRDIARGYHDRGDTDSAVVALEDLLRVNPDLGSADAIQSILDLWKTEKDQPEESAIP